VQWVARPLRAGGLSSAAGAAGALRRQPTKLETKFVRIPFLSAKRCRRGNRPFEAYRRQIAADFCFLRMRCSAGAAPRRESGNKITASLSEFETHLFLILEFCPLNPFVIGDCHEDFRVHPWYFCGRRLL
jgi:hypothetical protein